MCVCTYLHISIHMCIYIYIQIHKDRGSMLSAMVGMAPTATAGFLRTVPAGARSACGSSGQARKLSRPGTWHFFLKNQGPQYRRIVYYNVSCCDSGIIWYMAKEY